MTVQTDVATNLGTFERYPLLFGPSPVHRLERLTSHLGGAALWAKRDDCNSGLAYGGNKTRKLEYLVADALARGCDTLVSIGGVQSNHTRQVAAVAARTGMGCVLVQESWVEWPDVTYDRVGNIQLSRIMGADVRLVIDALELCYLREHIDTFVIASGDSDFCPLAYKLRENDRTVIGMAVKEATSPLFVKACDEFIYLRGPGQKRRDAGGGLRARRRRWRRWRPPYLVVWPYS